MDSRKIKEIFNRISGVVSPGHRVDFKKRTRIESKKEMDLEKKIPYDEIEKRLFKDPSLNQRNYADIINLKMIESNPDFLISLDDKQREIFKSNAQTLKDALNMNSFILNEKEKSITDKQLKKKMKYESKKSKMFSKKIDDNLKKLENYAKKFDGIDWIYSRPGTKYYADPNREFGKMKIPHYITNILYEVQKLPVEFGGGYSPELYYNDRRMPESIVLRKYKPTWSRYDQNSDLPIHTHPKRKLDFYYWNEDFARLNMEIKKRLEKTKEEKSKERLREIQYKITSPFDYLPSKMDVEIAKTNGKSNFQVSPSGIFVMTSPPDMTSRSEKLNFEFDKDMKKICEYAMIKSKLNKRFHSISQLEDRVEKYNQIIIDLYKKALDENKIRSEFYPKYVSEPEFIETEDRSIRYKNRHDDRYDIKTKNKRATATKKRFR